MGIIAIVAAVSKKNLAIGYQNRLPWDLPGEKAHFHRLVSQRIVVMGYHTWQSMGRPVVDAAANWVLTAQHSCIEDLAAACWQKPIDGENWPNTLTRMQKSELLRTFTSWSGLLSECLSASKCNNVMVIGGATLYQKMLPYTKRLYLTLIDGDYPGDSFFPDWRSSGNWQLARACNRSECGTALQYTAWRCRV